MNYFFRFRNILLLNHSILFVLLNILIAFFSAKKSYIDANPQIIQSFTNALQKGMDYVNSHSPEEIAAVIQPQFAETDLSQITAIVKRYHEQDTWKTDTIFSEEAFELLQNILDEAGVLEKRVDYDVLVTTEFSQ